MNAYIAVEIDEEFGNKNLTIVLKPETDCDQLLTSHLDGSVVTFRRNIDGSLIAELPMRRGE